MPGTLIQRGSGQESLTAIRSPVLTGPGSCGAFLMLENGVPIQLEDRHVNPALAPDLLERDLTLVTPSAVL